MSTTTPILTPKETAAVLARIDDLLSTLTDHLAHIALAGELNLEQIERLRIALLTANGLHKLFAAERIRHGGTVAPRQGES